MQSVKEKYLRHKKKEERTLARFVNAPLLDFSERHFTRFERAFCGRFTDDFFLI